MPYIICKQGEYGRSDHIHDHIDEATASSM